MADADAVVTPANPLDRVSIALPAGARLADLMAAKPAVPFSDAVIGFIEDLGRSLRSDPGIRAFPELVALGFWARGANIKRLRERFDAAYPEAVRMPRGLAFHVAPSNVDTIFVYSLLLSMLAGNKNLVRVSSRSGEQTNQLMHVLQRALEAASPEVRGSIAIARYDHDRAITDALSLAANIRIVWGGDATVDLIRQSPLQPAGTELVFPNKYSLAVIDADAWLAEANPAAVARDFVNDALWFGQMACSSPRAVIWRGSEAATAQASAQFWSAIETAAVEANLGWEDVHAVSKLLAEQDAAMSNAISILPSRTNHVRVIRSDLGILGATSSVGAGFFQESRIDQLDQLAGLAKRNWQTVVSYGIPAQDWQTFLRAGLPGGIDRVVRVGTALNFDAVWDGVDLLSAMTRLVAISV